MIWSRSLIPTTDPISRFKIHNLLCLVGLTISFTASTSKPNFTLTYLDVGRHEHCRTTSAILRSPCFCFSYTPGCVRVTLYLLRSGSCYRKSICELASLEVEQGSLRLVRWIAVLLVSSGSSVNPEHSCICRPSCGVDFLQAPTRRPAKFKAPREVEKDGLPSFTYKIDCSPLYLSLDNHSSSYPRSLHVLQARFFRFAIAGCFSSCRVLSSRSWE